MILKNLSSESIKCKVTQITTGKEWCENLSKHGSEGSKKSLELSSDFTYHVVFNALGQEKSFPSDLVSSAIVSSNISNGSLSISVVSNDGRENVQKNSTIKLVSEDYRYISNSYSGVQYYYPTLSQKDGVDLKLGGEEQTLVSGSNVTIMTTEKFPDSWLKKWSECTLLGAFTFSTDLYYWTNYGSKTNWIIDKVDQNSSAQEIYYGDEVYIRNEYYNNQYLIYSSDNYLTTKKEKYKWRIEK